MRSNLLPDRQAAGKTALGLGRSGPLFFRPDAIRSNDQIRSNQWREFAAVIIGRWRYIQLRLLGLVQEGSETVCRDGIWSPGPLRSHPVLAWRLRPVRCDPPVVHGQRGRAPRFGAPGWGEGEALASEVSQAHAGGWLLENGPRELESLFRAIVYHPSTPIFIADNERNYQDASEGAGRLLGRSRDAIMGQRIDDFADPGFKPRIPRVQDYALSLLDVDGRIVAWYSGAVRI